MRRLLRESVTDSTAVCRSIHEWLIAHPGLKTLSIFAALPGEVDLSSFVKDHPDRTWVYPFVRGEHLTFHRVQNPAEELLPGSFGIREPREDSPVVPVSQIDAFLCPGLAFDEHGGRLGRGRGFYDRVLASKRDDALKIGICFKFQRVPDTYSEAHDMHMDLVLSDEEKRHRESGE